METRLYRALLRLFPYPFVRRFGDEMTAVFLERHRAVRRRRWLAATMHWGRTVHDGVVSNSVAERRREIGIRLALGAQRGAVVTLVIRHALTLTAADLVIGVVISLFTTDVVAAFLFGVTALDVRTRVVVALVLVATTLIASLSPARRASRVDPAVALRGD